MEMYPVLHENFQVLFSYTTVGDILDDISEIQFSSGDDQETKWYLPEDQG